MHAFAVFNHQIIPAENSFLSAVSSAALYGKGIFTTIAIYRAKPFLWEKHWRRLTANAKKIGVDLSEFSEDTVKNSLAEIVVKNKFANARARITFFDGTASAIWTGAPNAESKTSSLIQTADFRSLPRNFRLTVSPFLINSKSPLAGVKSCNYLENILALEDAKANGFDEAIRLNERDEIASAATANVFWTKNNKIFTPALETGCLAGTTRALILENFAVEETKADLAEFERADEIFLTSAGIGVVQIAEFQNKKCSRKAHELTRVIEIS
jgi:branched-subunit amino acid aminotransferase/4-amino-4-deoxychorismate lyase